MKRLLSLLEISMARLLPTCSPLMAEAKAMKDALLLAQSLILQNIMLESGSDSPTACLRM